MRRLFGSQSQDPTPSEFARLVEEAYARIPARFRAMTDEIALLTPDRADQQTLDEMGIDHPLGLLGLYSGVDVTRKSLFDVTGAADTIYLYRLPIIAFAREGNGTIEEVVEHVLIHEIGHHFGFSDDDMHEIEQSED